MKLNVKKTIVMTLLLTLTFSAAVFAIGQVSENIKKAAPNNAKEINTQNAVSLSEPKTEKYSKSISRQRVVELYDQGYGLQDIEKAQELAASSGKSIEELLKEKGKPYEKKSWESVMKKLNLNANKSLDINTINTIKKIGLTDEQITELKERGIGDLQIIQIALLCKNYNKDYTDVIESIDTGISIEDLNKNYIDEYKNSFEYKKQMEEIKKLKEKRQENILKEKLQISEAELEELIKDKKKKNDMLTAIDLAEKYNSDFEHVLKLRKNSQDWQKVIIELGGKK